jgi:ribosomal protein S12 methylthiotransferase
VTSKLIETMAALPQAVHYLDMPLQHASVPVLRRMRRPSNMVMVRRSLADLREAMPGIALRTSLIVGFPGETESEFEELKEFLHEIRFDHVGVFTYSPQDGTPSATMPDQIPERVKKQRRAELMAVQQAISDEKHQRLIGTELEVLVEGSAKQQRGEDVISVGRSYRDAPEVDGVVLVRGRHEPGTFIRARITGALPYDLLAEPL